jgi:hypothetical protein
MCLKDNPTVGTEDFGEGTNITDLSFFTSLHSLEMKDSGIAVQERQLCVDMSTTNGKLLLKVRENVVLKSKYIVAVISQHIYN